MQIIYEIYFFNKLDKYSQKKKSEMVFDGSGDPFFAQRR